MPCVFSAHRLAASQQLWKGADLEYCFLGGPLDGTHTFPRQLGEWVVFFVDDEQRPMPAEDAFALVAYRQVEADADVTYQFAHCLTPDLTRFQIEYADGPCQGTEVSALPIEWLTQEIVRPLNGHGQPIRDACREAVAASYLAHYERRRWDGGHKYYLTKIAAAKRIERRNAA
jgi:hypothetical protein